MGPPLQGVWLKGSRAQGNGPAVQPYRKRNSEKTPGTGDYPKANSAARPMEALACPFPPLVPRRDGSCRNPVKWLRWGKEEGRKTGRHRAIPSLIISALPPARGGGRSLCLRLRRLLQIQHIPLIRINNDGLPPLEHPGDMKSVIHMDVAMDQILRLILVHKS